MTGRRRSPPCSHGGPSQLSPTLSTSPPSQLSPSPLTTASTSSAIPLPASASSRPSGTLSGSGSSLTTSSILSPSIAEHQHPRSPSEMLNNAACLRRVRSSPDGVMRERGHVGISTSTLGVEGHDTCGFCQREENLLNNLDGSGAGVHGREVLTRIPRCTETQHFQSRERIRDDSQRREKGVFETCQRDIRIINREDDRDLTYLRRLLIDGGNSGDSLVSKKVVDELGLRYTHPKSSFATRIFVKLAPWTRRAKDHARGKLRNIDDTVVRGQGGYVELTWYGENNDDIEDPIIYFPPSRLTSRFRVVKGCKAEVVLSWRDVNKLNLRDRYSAGITKPPTPSNDDAAYEDNRARKAAKAAAKEAEREKNKGSQTTSSGNSSPDRSNSNLSPPLS